MLVSSAVTRHMHKPFSPYAKEGFAPDTDFPPTFWAPISSSDQVDENHKSPGEKISDGVPTHIIYTLWSTQRAAGLTE